MSSHDGTRPHLPGHDLQLIKAQELAVRLGIDRGTLARWTRAGTFPPPIRLSARTFAWRVSAVEAWLKAREAS